MTDFWQLMEADKEFLNTTVDKVIGNEITAFKVLKKKKKKN